MYVSRIWLIFLSRYIDARPTASQVSTLMPMMTRTITATIPMIAPMSMYFTDSRISASPDWEFLDLRNAMRMAPFAEKYKKNEDAEDGVQDLPSPGQVRLRFLRLLNLIRGRLLPVSGIRIWLLWLLPPGFAICLLLRLLRRERLLC